MEFFDENVRVGEVPSTTPRQVQSKKGGTSQNSRYGKDNSITTQEEGSVLQKNNYKSVPLAVLADYNNRQAFKVKHPGNGTSSHS